MPPIACGTYPRAFAEPRVVHDDRVGTAPGAWNDVLPTVPSDLVRAVDGVAANLKER